MRWCNHDTIYLNALCIGNAKDLKKMNKEIIIDNGNVEKIFKITGYRLFI